jgi:hypothetical protein
LDRDHPLQALNAAIDGQEKAIDVGLVAGRVFLNNVSFGLYARAIADPDYRSHRALSLADAARDTAKRVETEMTLTLPDGRVVEDIEMLLASNNPYRFIGPPDFAARPALDTGSLGIIVGDRQTRLKPGPAIFTRWEAPLLILFSESTEVRAGVDGELRHFHAPIEIGIAPQALRVLDLQGVYRAGHRTRPHPYERSPPTPRAVRAGSQITAVDATPQHRRCPVREDRGMGNTCVGQDNAGIVRSGIALQDLDGSRPRGVADWRAKGP